MVKCDVVAQQHPRVLKQGRHSMPQHKWVMLNLRKTGKEEEKEGGREEKREREREGGGTQRVKEKGEGCGKEKGKRENEGRKGEKQNLKKVMPPPGPQSQGLYMNALCFKF